VIISFTKAFVFPLLTIHDTNHLFMKSKKRLKRYSALSIKPAICLLQIFFYEAGSPPDRLGLDCMKSRTESEAGPLGRPDC
jgi:hypothetical protein